MRNSKFSLRILGLSVLAILSTMALTPNAQAQLPGESTIGSFQINLIIALLATLSGFQGATRILVPGRNLTIQCQIGSTNGKINSGTDASGTVLLSGCAAWNLFQTFMLPCEVLSAGEPSGAIAAEALVKPILHGGKNYLLFEAIALNFTEVQLHGATCPLPLVNPVKGSIAAGVGTNDVVSPLIDFTEGIQLLNGDVLTFGGFSSYIDTIARVELSGEHIGDKLGIV